MWWSASLGRERGASCARLGRGASAAKDAAVFLQHIQDAIAQIEVYTAAGRRASLADTMVQDAVIRNLEVIGEAVRNLPLDLRRILSNGNPMIFLARPIAASFLLISFVL